MNSPLVSVVIPVYNCEKYIEQAIASVLAQDYKDLEIIIVDGNSTDKTLEIARSCSKAITISQVKPGISEGFNLGIKKAKGEFVAFLSGDDIWLKNKLTIQINFLLGNEDVEYTITKFKFFLENKSSLPAGFKKELINQELTGPTLETFVARKEIFKKVGLFDPNFSSALDIDWFARLKDMDIKMHIINEVLLLKRIHSQNISLNEKDNQKQMFRALRKSINRRPVDQ